MKDTGLITNIIANVIGRFWGIFSNFLFIPLYINYLGFESYSIISFSLIIAGLMAILDAGLTATLSRQFARKDNSSDEKIRIFNTLETCFFILIGISIILVYFFSDVLASRWLNLITFDSKRVALFLKIISFDVGFQLLFRFYLGGLLGLEKQVKANVFQILWGMFRNGFVIIAILFFPSLEVFFIWQTVSTVIFTILIGIYLKNVLTGQTTIFFKPKIEKEIFKSVRNFVGGMLLITIVASVNSQIDKLMISKLLSIEILGYYTLAVSLSMGILVLVNPVSVAILPRFTALYSLGKKAAASILFHKINLLISILVFSVTMNMIFFAKELIWIWTGKINLSEKVYPFIPFVAMSAAMFAIATIPYNIAIANGYTKLNNILGILSLIVTLPGYWLATKHFGAIGAAYVFCATQTTITLVYFYFINKKFIDTKNIITIYIKQMAYPFLITLSIAFMLFAFMPIWVAHNRFYAFLWIGAASVITLMGTLLMLVPKNDIKQVFNFKSIIKNKSK